MYPSRSRRPIISWTVGADSCMARAMLAPVIGRPASCSQKRICRYSSSATVAVGASSSLIRSAYLVGGGTDQIPRGSAGELVECALARGLILAPAPQLRAMADASGRDVVEVDLNDELGTQRHPLEVAVGAPAARISGAALTGLIGSEEVDQLTLGLRGET